MLTNKRHPRKHLRRELLFAKAGCPKAKAEQPYSITHMMQGLGRKHVRYINHISQRTATLWQGRYKASLIDSETYLLTCMQYIELNPVRASMVSHPG